mmetsp:Transcript_38108/g.109579  ORF Transcript_38108/g.109579 Transcript_38108/m.109579 type:complete len:649 (+) Transcript_38108:179-2125(+)
MEGNKKGNADERKAKLPLWRQCSRYILNHAPKSKAEGEEHTDKTTTVNISKFPSANSAVDRGLCGSTSSAPFEAPDDLLGARTQTTIRYDEARKQESQHNVQPAMENAPSPLRKGPWSQEEHQTLLKAIHQHGAGHLYSEKWNQVAAHFPHRSAKSVKDQVYSFFNKGYPKYRALREEFKSQYGPINGGKFSRQKIYSTTNGTETSNLEEALESRGYDGTSTRNGEEKKDEDITLRRPNQDSTVPMQVDSGDAIPLMSRTSHHKFGEIQPLDDIEKSPYEGNQSAEVSEPLFCRLKELLLSKEECEGELQDFTGKPSLTIQESTEKLFGKVLAESYVKAYHVIGKSGMLFSNSWLDQKECKIRGVKCGWVPKHMMILLLQEQRFGRAGEADLQNVVRDLGVASIFFDALDEWGFDDPLLWHQAPLIQFKSKKTQCLRSLIFVARAYRCIKVMKEDERVGWDLAKKQPTLYSKIQQCIELVVENLKINEAKLKQYKSKQNAEDEKAEKDRNELRAYLQSKQKKRQRREDSAHDIDHDDEEEEDEEEEAAPAPSMKSLSEDSSSMSQSVEDSTPRPPQRRRRAPKKARVATKAPSLPPPVASAAPAPNPAERRFNSEELLELFEMKYIEMGRILKRLKREARQSRETSDA